MSKKMNIKKAIDVLEELQQMTGSIEHLTALGYKEEKQEIEEVINFLKTQQELVTKFSRESDEYQKILDSIDLQLMNMEDSIKRMRGKI